MRQKMKNKGILHKDLCALIGSVGHGDTIIVCDAGFAVPKDVWRIELALERDVPTVERVLELLNDELIIEKYAVAEEMKDVNPVQLQKYRAVYAGKMIEEAFVPHERLSGAIANGAKAIVRTGAFQPYASIVIYPAIDAVEWYKAEGVAVPEFYRERLEK
jgi:D-ribose pyranose/furanose isomerase RbsD